VPGVAGGRGAAHPKLPASSVPALTASHHQKALSLVGERGLGGGGFAGARSAVLHGAQCPPSPRAQMPMSTKFESRGDPGVVRNYGRTLVELAAVVPDGLVRPRVWA